MKPPRPGQARGLPGAIRRWTLILLFGMMVLIAALFATASNIGSVASRRAPPPRSW